MRRTTHGRYFDRVALRLEQDPAWLAPAAATAAAALLTALDRAGRRAWRSGSRCSPAGTAASADPVPVRCPTLGRWCCSRSPAAPRLRSPCTSRPRARPCSTVRVPAHSALARSRAARRPSAVLGAGVGLLTHPPSGRPAEVAVRWCCERWSVRSRASAFAVRRPNDLSSDQPPSRPGRGRRRPARTARLCALLARWSCARAGRDLHRLSLAHHRPASALPRRSPCCSWPRRWRCSPRFRHGGRAYSGTAAVLWLLSREAWPLRPGRLLADARVRNSPPPARRLSSSCPRFLRQALRAARD